MSVYADILSDVKFLVVRQAGAATVIVRQELVVQAGEMGLLTNGIILIKPDEKVTSKQAFENQMQRNYKIGLAFVYAGNLNLDTGLADILDIIDVVPKALNVTELPTATTVWNSRVDYSPTFDTDALPKEAKWTTIEVTYWSQETRT